MEIDINALSIILATYKDKVENEILSCFQNSYNQLLQTEADCRRAKAEAVIMQMAKLKSNLSEFKFTYFKLKEKTGEIECINNFIRNIESEIKVLSYKKSNHLY